MFEKAMSFFVDKIGTFTTGKCKCGKVGPPKPWPEPLPSFVKSFGQGIADGCAEVVKLKKAFYMLYGRPDGRKLWVREDLKGKNKEYTLCVDCAKNKNCCKFEDEKKLSRLHSLTLVVWECPDFTENLMKEIGEQ